MIRSVILFYLILISLIANSQNTVYIEAEEFGRGIIKPRPGECFVITPLHVIETSDVVEITGQRKVMSVGEVTQGFASDLALIRINGGGEQMCEEWETPQNYSRLLSKVIEGFLELRIEDGGTKLMQVYISEKDEEFITIEPKRKNQSFSKGMSGGALFTTIKGERQFLGMLQHIDPETGSGIVIQSDDMDRVMGGFFYNSRKPDVSKKASLKIIDKKQVLKKFKILDIESGERDYKFENFFKAVTNEIGFAQVIIEGSKSVDIDPNRTVSGQLRVTVEINVSINSKSLILPMLYGRGDTKNEAVSHALSMNKEIVINKIKLLE